MQVNVTTWYLEMLAPDQLRPVQYPQSDLAVIQAQLPSPEFSRFLYATVGQPWYWIDRLSWSYDRWQTYLQRDQVETWVAYKAGTPAGYIELEAQPEGNVEVTYFGLLPQFIGQRIGGHLLTTGVQRAWTMGARRVWVHTCTLDGPYALKNYQARGFQLYNQSQHLEELPAQDTGPLHGSEAWRSPP